MSGDNPFSDNPFSDNPPGGNPPGGNPPGGNVYSDNPYVSPKGAPGGTMPGATAGPPPKNYLVEAILCLLCCGGVFAIPAIVYAAQVNAKHSSGDYHGAVLASENAKKWCIIALCIGVVCTAIGVGVQILAFTVAQ